jgi:hypothetical protein
MTMRIESPRLGHHRRGSYPVTRRQGDPGTGDDGAGEPTGDGDEVGAGVALLTGLACWDGRGELVLGPGLVGLIVGAEGVGVAVELAGLELAGLVLPEEGAEPAAAGAAGLTQR